MIASPLSINQELWRSSRLRLPETVNALTGARDAAAMLLAGFAAAVMVHYLDFGLRIPGHAILRSVLPVTLGMALAPRRLSGTLIGAAAVLGTFGCRAMGAGAGWGALTGMLAIGPTLDVALWQTRSGRSIALRCAVAGLFANLVAYGVRGGKKMAGLDSLSMRPLAEWWSVALVSYIVCGLIAGLIGGLLWFRAGRDSAIGNDSSKGGRA